MNEIVRQNHFIEPGYICITRVPTVLYTVVGNCVAVTLWDNRLRFGGMNHYLLPHTQDPSRATARYGNVAIATLVRLMEEAGARLFNLDAQIFGGAIPDGTHRDGVGQQNVETARRMLRKRGIRVVSEDVGGYRGRKIAFDSATGHVVIHKVAQIRETDWFDPSFTAG